MATAATQVLKPTPTAHGTLILPNPYIYQALEHVDAMVAGACKHPLLKGLGFMILIFFEGRGEE